jgi:membrane protein involved in colicin uptake
MSKRYVVLGLSIVLALALAVPALGGPTNPIASISASAKKTANKALKKAKAAQNTANSALSTANSALSTANSANGAAKKAQEDAKKAQDSANGAQASANSAKGTADAAKTTADEAKAAAAAAEANANSRVQGVYYKFGTSSSEDNTTPKNVSAFCNSGDEATGGGFSFNGSTNVTVTSATPTFYGDGWFVTGQAISGTPTWAIQANVVCTEK